MATSASHMAAEVPKIATSRLRPRNAQTVDEMRGRAREARVPARRQPSGRLPGEALGPVRVAGSQRDEHHAEGRAGREGDAGQEHRPALADRERPEEDQAERMTPSSRRSARQGPAVTKTGT